MELFVYAFVALLLTILCLKKQSGFPFLLFQFLPIFFLLSFLWINRKDYEVLQVQKEGYQFQKVTDDYRNPARRILIGGSQQNDDLFFQELPPAALKLIPSLVDTSVELEVLQGGIFITKNEEPLNAIPLNDRDRIGSNDNELIFHRSGAFARSFRANGKEWLWPQRVRGHERLRGPLTKSFETNAYSLSTVAKALQVPITTGAAFSLQRFRFSPGRRPLLINTVLLMGANAKLKINSKPVPQRFSLVDSDRIRIYRIDSSQSPVRLWPVASFILKNSDSFYLFTPVPQTLGMKENHLRNGSVFNKPLLVTTTSLPYSVFPTALYAKESRNFSGLFAFIQTKNLAPERSLEEEVRHRLGKLLAIEKETYEVVTDRGTYRLNFGERFALGANDKILFSLNKIRFPWNILRMVIALLLLKAIFQPPFFRPVENLPLQLLLIGVDFFLISRFLFSFRAAGLYPFSSEAVQLSLLSFLLVPYMIFCALVSIRQNWERTHILNFSTYSIAVLLFSAVSVRNHLWLCILVVLLASAVAFLRFFPRGPLRSTASSLETTRKLAPDTYLVLFFIFALLLQWLGTGEAVRIAGVRIPLAILYQPVFLAGSAYYLWRLKENLIHEKSSTALSQSWSLLMKFFALLLCSFLLSFLMSDFGFFLLYCLPVLFILLGVGVLYLSEYKLKWKVAGACMIAPVGIFILVFSSFHRLDRILPGSYFRSVPLQRVLLAVDPSALEESGYLTAERQVGHQRIFLAYAHSGLHGGGYMNRPISSAVSATALNDNVSSVFLLNDFGALGFAAVLILLLTWLWLWIKTAEGLKLTYRHFLSLASLITFLYVDLYMIFGNCGIVLFTGKNVFLWGLNSTSDIFQSALLISFIIVPMAKSQTAPVPEPISFVGIREPAEREFHV